MSTVTCLSMASSFGQTLTRRLDQLGAKRLKLITWRCTWVSPLPDQKYDFVICLSHILRPGERKKQLYECTASWTKLIILIIFLFRQLVKLSPELVAL